MMREHALVAASPRNTSKENKCIKLRDILSFMFDSLFEGLIKR